jgi:hypothetical protein
MAVLRKTSDFYSDSMEDCWEGGKFFYLYYCIFWVNDKEYVWILKYGWVLLKNVEMSCK